MRVNNFLKGMNDDELSEFKTLLETCSRVKVMSMYSDMTKKNYHSIIKKLNIVIKVHHKMLWVTNGVIDKFTFDDCIEDGYYKGRVNNDYTCNSSSYRWYTNGEKNIFVCDESKVPDGFHRGTCLKTTVGKKWCNNGKIRKLVDENNIPEGFHLGAIIDKSNNYKKAAEKRKVIYCTNGFENKKLKYGESIPDGYVLGKTSNKKIIDNYYRSIGYIQIGDLSKKQLNAYRYFKSTGYDFKTIFKDDTYTYIHKNYLPMLDEYSKINHSKGTSNEEQEVLDFIKSSYDGEIRTNVKSLLKDKDGNYYELDIYIPDLKIAIEFNGNYWHSSENKDKNYHFNKSRMCEDIGIRLIHIYEYEWEDIILRDKIKMMLRIALQKCPNKIYARNCEVRLIDNKIARELNTKIHLQGHRNAQVTYGLYFKGELVQLMSFSKTKYNRNLKTENSWEIIRGCPGSNNIVVGGVSKLFKHFINDYNPDEVFSYCDFNKFNGKSYEELGMKFIGYTGPDMKWVMKDGSVRNRLPSKHNELKDNSIYRIYGSGSKKYVFYRVV